MQALIDFDIVAYRSSAGAKNDPVEAAYQNCDILVQRLLDETGATTYRGFLSGEDNFRYQLFPEYKANRKDQEKPQWLQACRAYLLEEWSAEMAVGHEADDALAIAQTDNYYSPGDMCYNYNTVIISLDKDLLQVPGKHYQWQIEGGPIDKRWVKEAKWYDISYIEGLRNFYISSLVGDIGDNISGVSGLGKVKARKLLSNCNTEQEMFDTCRKSYNEDKRYFLNLKLLWLKRSEDDIFDPEKRGLLG